tara:strand:+ start:4499 stop:5209 length:711 start_codon:yes stop_codon:yes gene_type:complete
MKIIIIPTYNEKKNIKILLNKIFNILQNIRVLIIDDTPNEELKSEIVEFKNVTYIHRVGKKGRGSAVLTGMNHALQNYDFTYLIEMDADLSHNPNELPDNLAFCLKNKLDLLVSSRYLKKSKIINWPLKRKILSYLANFLAKNILKVPIQDYTNGFRIYSKKSSEHVVKNCGKVGDGFIILSEILVHLYYSGFNIQERPTVFVDRVRGNSNVNLIEIIRSLLGLFKIYFLKNNLKK